MQNVTVDRHKYIGGSDIPIIMGISTFKSRFDLLLEKSELKENDFDGNSYTEYGNVMEGKIREYINSTNLSNNKYEEDMKIIDDIRCHVDGFNGNSILEIKTTSQVHNNVEDYKVYLVQLLFYMMNYGVKGGVLAVYSRPEDFNEEFDCNRLQTFYLNIENFKDLCSQINKAVDQFRIDLQKVKDNPLITEEELMPTDLTELSNKVLELENQLTAYNELVKQRDMFKEKLHIVMSEKGVKQWRTPNGILISNVLDGEDKEIQKFNESKFAEENAELYETYLETKIQKGRKGSVRFTFPKEEK